MSDVPPPPPPPPAAPPPPGMPRVPGAGGSEEKNNLGIIALVLGILGILCCWIFTAIPAIIVGKKSQEAEAQGLATNGQMGKIGVILGWVGIIVGAISIPVSLIFFQDGLWG